MLPTTETIQRRFSAQSRIRSKWHLLHRQAAQTTFNLGEGGGRNRFLTSSKFIISIGVTFVIIITQVLIFHYYYLSSSGSNGSSSGNSFFGFGESQANRLKFNSFEEWNCAYPGLSDIFILAQKFDVDLVVIDPDLLHSFDPPANQLKIDDDQNSRLKLNFGQDEQNKQQQSKDGDLEAAATVAFSEPFQNSKSSQEPRHKTIIHLAAINETSGGQPNLKLFYNSLKSDGYTMLKYVDTSQLMQPEVYRRASHLFDDMPLDGVRVESHKHDSHDSKDINHLENDQRQPSDQVYKSSEESFSNSEEVSKIYTEFITHIFILNSSKPENPDKRLPATCKDSLRRSMADQRSKFTVIHVLVLYNYEYNPKDQWIQAGLEINEMDKHKLLAYNVHYFDFKIPIEQYYIHQKRSIVSISKATTTTNQNNRRKRSYLERINVFELQGNRLLSYANNTHIHCKTNPFNISEHLDNQNRMSNYLRALDLSKPIENIETRQYIRNQLVIALQFMNTYSKAYENFSFWLTGSTLLAYHKYCDLALVPPIKYMDFFSGSEMDPNQEDPYSQDNIVINLELGLFASEVNETVLDDLASAHAIGVSMMSDWKKSESSALITFQLRDCPNIIFNIYLYELRKDFYQYYFITRNTMTMSHKFNKKFHRQQEKRTRTKQQSSKYLGGGESFGHHVFNTNNLDLCWTRIDNFHPFRVPCNVYEHLRRIFII